MSSQRDSQVNEHHATERINDPWISPANDTSLVEPAPPEQATYTMSTSSSQEPAGAEALRSSGRPKRPIDIAFENMRAYTEPPFRQSVTLPANTQTLQQPYHYPPPPMAPPTPPPKSPSKLFMGSLKSRVPPKPQRAPPPPPSRPSVQHGQNSFVAANPDLSMAASPIPRPVAQESAPSASSKGKGRLTLRNPLTLLARRRSSQVLTEVNTSNKSTTANPLRKKFDPSIRGKVVHDFSAPRPERPQTAGSRPLEALPPTEGEEGKTNHLLHPGAIAPDFSPGGPDHDHAPVFKEHFDEEEQGTQTLPIKKSEAFMNAMSKSDLRAEPDPAMLPAFARNLPTNLVADAANLHKSPILAPNGPLEAVSEGPGLPQTSVPSPPRSTPSTRSRRSHLSFTNDQSLQGIGSPRRFKSNASRFSFDLAGVGSAVQEKLLEDKHRQRQFQKARMNVVDAGNNDNEEENDQDYDELGDDGLEEKIPGINADEDDFPDASYGVSQQTLDQPMQITPNKSSFESATISGSTGLTSPGTPREPYETAKIHIAPGEQTFTGRSGAVSDLDQASRPQSTPGPRTSGLDAGLQRGIASESNLASLPRHHMTHHDDDLYYDDGMIEDIGDDASSADFDESVFDDNSNGLYGLPLRDRTLKPLEIAEMSLPDEHDSLTSNDMADQMKGQRSSTPSLPQSASESLSAELRDGLTDLCRPKMAPVNRTGDLTHCNLAAHTGADLAIGVQKASEQGAFDRRYSESSYGEVEAPGDQEEVKNRSSGLMFDMSGLREDDLGAEDDDDDDDDIVAAANAEALENDDDGFYGQEFGFYARASGEAEYVNGGYFGQAPAGVYRSHSGRADFQEPSLTPITERSEWSNRNSMVSMAKHGYSLPASTHPSEHQLSTLMDVPEDAMTLEALMRLRRTTFGGSNVSLHSSSNSQNSGSPVSHLPSDPMTAFKNQQAHNDQNKHADNVVFNSAAAIGKRPSTNMFQTFDSASGHGSSTESDGSPSASSPTITVSAPFVFPAPPTNSSAPVNIPVSPMFVPQPSRSPLPSQKDIPPISSPPNPPSVTLASSLPTPSVPDTMTSLISRSTNTIKGKRTSWTGNAARGHTRSNSDGSEARRSAMPVGMESVSYKEEDGNWVLEKRRTGEQGEVHVVGRSIVEKGRI